MSATEPAPGAVAAQETGAPADPAPPVYADVEAFVVGFLAPPSPPNSSPAVGG